mmetsp:Transcript_4369/g.3659  ORF Transcript_4369/g.3659 Transcript_4369/m.3659 type:complete len:103 (+) Transcript_4369:286-594(+)
MVYFPDTYNFEKIYKYTETLPPVEKFFNQSNDIEARLDVPNRTENMESNFGLNRSGDDSSQQKNKDGRPTAPVYNIYKKGDAKKKTPEKAEDSDSDKDSSSD